MSRRERTSIAPALVVSVVVHVAVIGAVILFAGLFRKPLQMGGGVPVTLVAEGPTILRDAPQAEEESVAQTPEPAPLPPEPEPVPPTPQPKPTPTPPKPAAKPTPPKPSPTGKAKPQPSLDLDALLSDVQASRPKPKPGGGAQGKPKPNGTPVPGTAKTNISQASKGYLNRLGEEFASRWHPNCEVQGGDDVAITMRVVIGSNGRLIGEPTIVKGNRSDPVTQAAIARARFAARAAQPYRDYPPELVGQEVDFALDAKSACST